MKKESESEGPEAGVTLADQRVVIKPSAIHGKGVFARVNLSAGTRLIEYVGEKISKVESLRRCESGNPFIFALDGERDLEGDVAGNLARFINHSCAPNCEALLEGDRIWVVARRAISAGEEITFNYGYDLEDYRDHPCHCGTAECAGYMVAEEYLDSVRRLGAVQ